MDIRSAPRKAQEVAFEQGLTPYIPADRDELAKLPHANVIYRINGTLACVALDSKTKMPDEL